jgi:hypothetical protein
MTVVRQYVDAFNKSDAAMAANCAEPTRVLDGLAPHVCRGLQLAGYRNTSICTSAIGRALRPAMSFGWFGARSMHGI